MGKRKGRGYWLAVAESFDKASVSQTAFCTRHDLNIGTFRSWLYRFREERETSKPAKRVAAKPVAAKPGKPSRFVEVMASAPAERCVVRLGDVEIEFQKLPHVDYLSNLLANLGSTTK